MAYVPVASQAVGTITFGTSGFTAGLLDINGPDMVCEWLDTTNMGTPAQTGGIGNKTGIPSKYIDIGELEITIQHVDKITPPVGGPDGELETITITSGTGSNAGMLTGQGVMLKYKATRTLDGKVMTAVATIRGSGLWTMS